MGLVEAVINERVQPLSSRYVQGFDVQEWLKSRPDVAAELNGAHTEREAMEVFKAHLRPYLEQHEGSQMRAANHCPSCTCQLLPDVEEAAGVSQ